MKILQLHIENIRGIRSLDISPQGRNQVIWGPNGSGKSAVVDAIDFLLTGIVSRITGAGTGGITLKKHGPHIDSSPEYAKVSALVLIPGLPEPIEISRSMNRPTIAQYEEAYKPYLEPILKIAHQGQHVLTRRDILRFIAADSSSRAEGIQQLLNLSEVENIRRNLVRVRNDSDGFVSSANREVDGAKTAVNSTLHVRDFSLEAVLIEVNRNRSILGVGPISQLVSSDLKSDISLPQSVGGVRSINVTLVKKDFDYLLNIISIENAKKIVQTDAELRSLMTAIRSDPENLLNVTRSQLVEIGLSLLQDSGECPLCETPWPPGSLKDQLEQRLVKAESATKQMGEIERLSLLIQSQINGAVAALTKIVSSLQAVEPKQSFQILIDWQQSLNNLAVCLSNPLSRYPDPRFTLENISRLLAPPDLEEYLDKLYEVIQAKYPDATPEQTAWTILTALEENLKALEKAQASYNRALLFQKRAHTLHDVFLSVRDQVLGELYDQISERFACLYKKLHGMDEENFRARIAPDGAGMAFEVDFYGRGSHPPLALHSEGHQDSMGLCLYLALAERLTKGLIGFTILDDVVMSVDSDHRREVCSLLSQQFPDRQFIITTHDKTWAHQLKSEGVVCNTGYVEFYKWTIDTGPYVNVEVDLWQRIDSYLANHDVPNAAFLLRRGSEEFFAYACDSLEASVKYRLDGINDLGDFMSSVMSQYGGLLRHAKRSAQYWKKSELLETLKDAESVASQIFQRTKAEQWAVNTNVHFNNWHNFSPEDFLQVREAFQDFHNLFICQDCGSVIHLTKKKMEPQSVVCNCGQFFWNLVEKTS